MGGDYCRLWAEPSKILKYSYKKNLQKDVKKQQGVARGEPFASIAETGDKHVRLLQ